jgi:hypothetical protein
MRSLTEVHELWLDEKFSFDFGSHQGPYELTAERLSAAKATSKGWLTGFRDFSPLSGTVIRPGTGTDMAQTQAQAQARVQATGTKNILASPKYQLEDSGDGDLKEGIIPLQDTK